MTKKHVTEHLVDYLDGILNEAQNKKITTHLKECSPCQKELNELRGLLKIFKSETTIEPSEDLRANFFAVLEKEKKDVSKIVAIRSKSNLAPILFKIAAGIALLLGSFFLGKFQQTRQTNRTMAALISKSLEDKQTAMLSLMENQSASRRIQGVNYIEEFKNPDEAIVMALANRMLYDENTNVRLAAAESLSNFTASETVKNAFITALETEKDPRIQITIIQTLVRIQERKAIAPMKKLLNKEDTQPFVKNQIESLLPQII